MRKEEGALAYEWYLSEDRKPCLLLETYKDANAVLARCTGPVVQGLVPNMLESSRITSFEVYGDPGVEAARILVATNSGNPPLITCPLRYSVQSPHGPWYISLPCIAEAAAAL